MNYADIRRQLQEAGVSEGAYCLPTDPRLALRDECYSLRLTSEGWCAGYIERSVFRTISGCGSFDTAAVELIRIVTSDPTAYM